MKAFPITMLLATTLGSCAAFAQNSDFSIFYGISPQRSSVESGSELVYARQILDRSAGSLFIEIPAVFVANSLGSAAIFFAPGVRFKFPTQSRTAFYLLAGGGVASSSDVLGSRRTSPTVDVGGGIEFRVTRLLSVRGQARDFITQRFLGFDTGRNHAFFELGIGLHF